MKKFPHTVQLHRKYAGDGLVVMSLDIEQSEWEQKDKVLNFLTKQEATFPNYIFKDRPQKVDDWLEKYDASPAPALVVFDRRGKRVAIPSLDEDKVEEQLKKLLDAK